MSLIYFCIWVVIVFLALTIGLVSGVYFKPPDMHTDKEIFMFAGMITSLILLAIYLVYLYMENKGIISNVNKKIIDNR